MVLAGAGAVAWAGCWRLGRFGAVPARRLYGGEYPGRGAGAALGLLQLPFYFGVLILVQLLASQNRYRLMSGIAVANFALKAALNAVLAPRMGAAGIMLATSLMYLLSFACYLAVALRRAEPKRPIECPPFNAPPARSACCCSFIRCTAAAPSGWPWT